MSKKFKKCQNGHYYDASLEMCPYCPSVGYTSGDATEIFQASDERTQFPASGGGENETIGDFDPELLPPTINTQNINKTEFFDTVETEGKDGSRQTNTEKRDFRKLVGWLVSYTLDERGVDFKLYEGRNIIGRDAECQIIIEDSTVTSRHAILLFRNGKYSITDQQSSHGTYVNGEDIELEPRYLKDGDMIRIGQTDLKFRSSF